MSTAPTPFGAILAGGRSVRYGSPKALATVAGESILDRVRRALLRVTPDLILIANEPSLFARSGLPTRPDTRPGLGALGGIHAALLWAREAGRPGILAVACDMPFLDPALLVRILERAAAGDVDVVAPESGGRRGGSRSARSTARGASRRSRRRSTGATAASSVSSTMSGSGRSPWTRCARSATRSGSS